MGVLADATDFCRLILLRHPELAHAHSGRAVGAAPADLSRRGRERVLTWRASLAKVTVNRIFAADLPQCSEPAMALAEAKQLTPELDPRLRDQDLGDWTGRSWKELLEEDPGQVNQFFEHFGEVAPPSGESLGASVDRFLDWWTEQAPQGVGKCLAVISSGAMIAGFTAAMLGMRLSRSLSLHLPHGGMAVLEVYQNGTRLVSWHPQALSDAVV